MYIEYAETARMSSTGSSLLRAIQNNSTPTLDLIVRESIQNSLDASGGKKPYVCVNYNTGEFQSEEIAEVLEGISKKLTKKYPGRHPYISINDSFTEGLSGPMRYDEVRNNDYGNLIKLVYEISKPQSNEGAGGSWGLGKTVYFRMGIGIVIYYSRIKKQDGSYESRLAACLVEDEEKEDALLKRPNQNIERGIAWWGNRINNAKETFPITDEVEIKRILDIFGLELYTGYTTGTCVIIPYVAKDKLLKEVYRQYKEDCRGEGKSFWMYDIESYLRVAIQKWYHPRIDNPKYKYGSYLRAHINGVEIKRKDFYPYFDIMQELYICALESGESLKSYPDIKVKTKNIKIQNILAHTSKAGTLVHAEVDESLLKMLPPNNMPDPYEFVSLENEDKSNNPVILGYTRKTGMIVTYQIMGPWTDNTPKAEHGKYILALFVLNSDNKIKDSTSKLSLEEYIRQGEQADHTNWNDWSFSSGNPLIVTRIQRNVRKELTDSYKKEVGNENIVEDIGMGREFAKLLLPPIGYGRDSSTPGRKPRHKTIAKTKKMQILIGKEPQFKNNKVIFDFDLVVPNYVNPITLTFKAITEQLGVNAEDWENDDNIGNRFPIKISSIEIEKAHINDVDIGSYIINPEKGDFIHDTLRFDFLKTSRFMQRYGVRIYFNSIGKSKSKLRLQGKLVCNIYDPLLKVGIELSEVN